MSAHYSDAMDDDELAKLMREIDQFDSKGATPATPAAASPLPEAASSSSREVAAADAGAGAKTKWIVVSAAIGGGAGLVVGAVVPFFLGSFQTGVGAALGGALAALIGRPPTWLK